MAVPSQIVLITGVSGSGKTTIGRMLAADLGWAYYEGDDFHPAANIKKMAEGIPLNDEDRAPWLAALRQQIDTCAAEGKNAVVSCSALKQKYREVLTTGIRGVLLVFLRGDFDTILNRLNQRAGHYMKGSLLRSQFDALEIPTDALTMDVGLPPAQILAAIKERLFP